MDMQLVIKAHEDLTRAVLTYKLEQFPPGTPVLVTGAPSYSGPGIVAAVLDDSCNILVRLSNDNEWRYPLSTISRLPKDQYPDWIKKYMRRKAATKRWLRRQEIKSL